MTIKKSDPRKHIKNPHRCLRTYMVRNVILVRETWKRKPKKHE